LVSKKLPIVLLLCLFLASAASAAVTTTVSKPASNEVIANTYANHIRYPITFTVTDNNATVPDMNATIKYWVTADSKTVVVADLNLKSIPGATFTGNDSDINCAGGTWASKVCTYYWDMPLQTAMPDGTYVLDVNVNDYNQDGYPGTGKVHSNADANNSVTILISNRLATMDTAKSIMNTAPIIGIGGFLVFLVMSLFVLKMDPKVAVITGVAGGIAMGIATAVLGFFLAIL